MYTPPSAALLGALAFTFTAALAQRPVVFGGDSGPNTGGCDCVVILNCPSLLPPRGVRITYEQSALIRSRRCGYEGNSIKVCCPDSVGPATPSPAPTSTLPTALPLTCGVSSELDKIFGGTNAPLGAHPWMAALGYRGPALFGPTPDVSFSCGGALVTSQHVVTAGHCVHPSNIGVQSIEQINLGDWNLLTDPDCTVSEWSGRRQCAPAVTVRRPAKVTWHPLYNSNGAYNYDVALIRLDRPVKFSPFLQPICIPNNFDPERKPRPPGVAIGWGRTENTDNPPILQQVRLPFVNIDTCNATWGGQLWGHQICAGGEAGTDTCKGDSGGPLITTGQYGPPFQLVGLTSFGSSRCGAEGTYAVYTAISEFRPWIVENLAN